MPEPIDCREAEDRLQDYLKRELTPELAVEVRVHLERCRSCFHHARFEGQFLRMLEERARRETCPGALRERILQALRAEAERG
jgi:anti-sigma factor (TIGR02949 family)